MHVGFRRAGVCTCDTPRGHSKLPILGIMKRILSVRGGAYAAAVVLCGIALCGMLLAGPLVFPGKDQRDASHAA